MSKEAKRERVDNLDTCSTTASIAEYLEDNPFGFNYVYNKEHKILIHALYKPTNLNFTQYQLKLQELQDPQAEPRAYAVLLRIMEIRFGLERLEL